MKPVAPGTVIFHRHRGYGVIVHVNLMTGWISARFGNEPRTLDLNLSTDEVQHADGEAILFRRSPPDRMPHARLMAMVRDLHRAGYEKLYLHSWPKPSGLHWRWHLFTGQRDWMQRPWREGWYGSGADYNGNPVMGWGDAPGATTDELIHALAKFDPEGLARALGRDEDHTAWFAGVCDALLPGYMYSFDMAPPPTEWRPGRDAAGARGAGARGPARVCRSGDRLAAGLGRLWTRRHVMPMRKPNFTGEPELR
jgi:hypothetical protein